MDIVASGQNPQEEELDGWMEAVKVKIGTLSADQLRELRTGVLSTEGGEIVKALEDQLKDATERLNALRHKQAERATKIKDLQNKLEVAEKDEIKLQKEFKAAEKEENELQDKLKAVEKDEKELLDELKEADGRLSKLLADKAVAEEAKVDLQGKLTETQKKIQDIINTASQENDGVTELDTVSELEEKLQLKEANTEGDDLRAKPIKEDEIQPVQTDPATTSTIPQVSTCGGGTIESQQTVVAPQSRWWNIFMICACVLCGSLTFVSSMLFEIYSKNKALKFGLTFVSPIAVWGPALIGIRLSVRADKYTWTDCINPRRWGANHQSCKDGLVLWAGILAQFGRVVHLIALMMLYYHYFVLDLSCLSTIAGVIPLIREILG